MATYNYTAKDKQGKSITGSVEADNERSAAARIREDGLYPQRISPVRSSGKAVVPDLTSSTDPKSLGDLFSAVYSGVGLGTLGHFFRQLYIYLKSGMTVTQSLENLSGRMSGKMAKIAKEMAIGVQAGKTMSETIARHHRAFGPLPLAIMRTAEQAGNLEAACDRIATYFEWESALRRKIAVRMFYPALIFLAIIFVPKVPVLVMQGFKPFAFAIYSLTKELVFAAVVAYIVVKIVVSFRVGRYVWDRIKIVPPVLGTAARKIAMTRFLRSYLLMYESGQEMSRAIAAAADASANEYIRSRLMQAVPLLQQGKGVVESLEKTGVLLPIVLEVMTTGEATGNMHDGIVNATEIMDQEVDATFHIMTILFFVLAILVAAYIVLMIVTNFYTGMFEETIGEFGF